MRLYLLGLGLLLTATGTAACSDGGGGVAAGTGGSSSGMGGTVAGGGASSTGGARAGGGGSTGGAAFTQVGVCGQRGKGMVTATAFEGYEEYYLIGEEGFGADICVVRFDVRRVGEARGGCTDCEWTHKVGLSNPKVVTDEGGVCEMSELAFDAAKIAATAGAKPEYGFVSEFQGHNSVLVKYDEQRMWDAFGNATWDPDVGTFRFDRRNGICGY